MADIHGTSGDDTLLGTIGSDVLMGHEGNDLLSGNAGYDLLSGGLGDDTLVGGEGGDDATYLDATAAVYVDLASGVASGGDGNDQLIGIGGVAGSAYDDTLLGDDQSNSLDGMDGKDILNGAGGDDTLYLNFGDTVTGGDGKDIFTVYTTGESSTGVPLITDLALGEIIDMTIHGPFLEISAGDGSGVLDHDVQVSASVGGMTRVYFGEDDIPGADYSIDLVGNFSAEDFVLSDLTSSMLTYDPALNQPQMINQNDGWVEGGGGNDTIDGSLAGGGQHLYGNAGDDLVIGGSKNDTLSGGMGNDTLQGGDGVDTASYAWYLHEGIQADLGLGVVTGGAGNDSLVGIENIQGTAQGDTLIGDDADNYLSGGGGNNAGSDSLYGKGGNDFLESTGSYVLNGFMSGGVGNDTMVASNGWHGVMSGDEGNDTFFVRNGNQTVIEQAGQGFDSVLSSLSSYTLPAGIERGVIVTDQAASLSGNALNNFLRAGAGDNVLKGGLGVDRVAYAGATAGVTVSLAISGSQATGGSGNDTLISIENLAGSRYNDNLSGNAGDNVLLGGFGQDTLTGNGGNDRFNFNTLKATGNTPASADIITDFSSGDLINLKKIDADTATTDNEDFTTLLSAGEDFTQAAQLKFVDGVLYGNVDADLEAEFAIVLTGVTSLSVSDLML